ERHRIGRRSVRRAERRRLAGRLHVEDEVDVALREPQHVLRAVLRDGPKAHQLEQLLQPHRLRRGELDELEAVRTQRIVEQVGHAFPPGETRLGEMRRSPAITSPGAMSVVCANSAYSGAKSVSS